ncbi:hypothetical protein Tco_0389016 [Tanacetum coccineum]
MLAIPLHSQSISMVEIVSKEAQKKSKVWGIQLERRQRLPTFEEFHLESKGDHTFNRIFIDYRVTLGFGSTSRLDLACNIIRLSSQYGIHQVIRSVLEIVRINHCNLDILPPIRFGLSVMMKQWKEDEGDMNVGWDIIVKDVERLRLVHDKEKIVRKEEHDYDIPLRDGVMQPLTPQTVHITPPDDDYVAPATSPTLDKQLNEFGKECSDITRVAKKANCNLVNDVKELYDINKYDCEIFIRKLLHQVSQSSHETVHGFVGYPFDYRITLGFDSIAGGLDHVNPIIRLLLEHGTSRVLEKDDHFNPSVGTNPVTMHLLLNPSQREELENEVRSREELTVLQVEFVDMEGQMHQLMKELKKSQKNAFFWKSAVIMFGVVASFMFVMN